MSIIRHRQQAVTRLTPNNGNKRYIKTIKKFDPYELQPLPAWEREWRSGGVANYDMTFPVDIDPMAGSTQVACEVAWYANGTEQPLFNAGDWSLRFVVGGGGLQPKLQVGLSIVTFTNITLGRARWYKIQLFFVGGNPSGIAQLYIDSQYIGQLVYPQAPHVAGSLVACAGAGLLFAGVAKNVVTGGNAWPVNDNANTLDNTGTNPSGDGVVTPGTNTGIWQRGSVSAINWQYIYSVTDTVVGIDITLDRPWSAAVTTAGLNVTLQPVNTPVTNLTANIIGGTKLRLSFDAILLTGGQTIRVSYIRTLATTIPLISVFYNIPRTALLSEKGLEE